jgi:hypothetical protein
LTERRISGAEGWAVFLFCMAASVVAIVWSWNHGAMLNYGDAVAHLHIARRVFDSRTPRFTQLGSVWLPLPHILLIPFVQSYQWWATGLAGVIPSAVAYLASCAGIYCLARHWLNPAASAIALAFFALNPNLLYLQTTAMTEPLFLCEFIWIVVWMVEWRLCLDRATAQDARDANRLQACIAAMLVASIFTRYDGWIIALLAWTGIGLTLLRRALHGERGRLSSPAFWLPSIAVIAAPICWFLYNAVGFGDWLYFARGPFSAKAIELRTATISPGWPLHPGWHNPWVALLYYLKISELDFTAPTWGNLVLALAALGTALVCLTLKPAFRRHAFAWLLLLWLPVFFYAWSVAYGSVPIFFPAWWPHTWYNTRYGLELLPALALGLGFAAQWIVDALCGLKLAQLTPRFPNLVRVQQMLPNVVFTALFVLAGLNAVVLLRLGPLVYVESTKNLDARLPYDHAIPPFLQQLLAGLPHAPVLMNTSTYPEIVSLTGIPLRQTINESDLGIFRAALAAPSSHAAVIVAFDGDDIDRAIKAHSQDLRVAGRFTAPGQPSATVYLSSRWISQSRLRKTQSPASTEK